jgi:integrase
MELTPTTIRTLSLPEGKTDETFTDDDLPGLGLRIRAGGSKTWVYRYKLGARYRRVTLGLLAALTPGQARKAAGDLHAMVRLGRDPAGERDEGRARAAETMGAALAAYLPYQRSRLRPRSYAEVERHLQKHWRTLHVMPLTAIDRRAVAARLAVIAEQSGPVQANRARASLQAFFGWAIREGLADANPVAATGKRPERSRDRVLSPDELKAIWAATADESDYSAVIRLLMLTGARLNEIAALRWSEVQDDRIILPAPRTKNGRQHEIALSAAARAILDGRPRRPGRDLIFGRRHARPLSGWTELKAGLDARIAAAGEPLPHWTHHDVRRTVATMMAEIGVAPHVIEEVIGHVSGTSAVSRIYRRSGYEREVCSALALWANHVQALVEGREPLRGAS